MKTKDLIKMLEENDPSGEYEVCIENSDIQYCQVLPAYYDGRITLIKERDGWFARKSEVTGSGMKLNLYRHSWRDNFLDEITDNQKEYPVDSGNGAAGQKGYNWLDADVIATKFKLTYIAETYDFYKDEQYNKILECTKQIRSKYIKHITVLLKKYIKENIKTHAARVTALKLIKKCEFVEFPLEVFRHGDDYIVNQNANWRGYDFKIDNNGKFYVKDYINNSQIEQRGTGTYDCTPYVEEDINTYNFNNVVNLYIEKMKNSDY